MKEVKILCPLADYRRFIDALSKCEGFVCLSAGKVMAMSPGGIGAEIDLLPRMRIELLVTEHAVTAILQCLSLELTVGLHDVWVTEATRSFI